MLRTLCVQGEGGSRSLRTYCDWVVSNAEIDHLTQVNLCASPTSTGQKYPEVLRTY